MSDQVKRQSRLKWVPLALMIVSPKAQASFSKPRAEKIAANFDLEALGFLVLSYRDGRYFIIDGQHRAAALKIMDWGDQQVQCEVYEGMTEEEEAELFLLRNEKRNPTAFDKFSVALTAGRPTETEIDRVVRNAGLRIARGKTENTVSAVGALGTVYGRGGSDVLDRTVRIASASWGGDRAAVRSEARRGGTE